MNRLNIESSVKSDTKGVIYNFLLFIVSWLLQLGLNLKPTSSIFWNFPLLVIVYNTISFNWLYNLLLSICSGIIFDVFSGAIWGTYLITFLLTWISGYILSNIFEKNSLLSIFVIGESQIIVFFASLIIIQIITHSYFYWANYLLSLFCNALLFAGVVYLLLRTSGYSKKNNLL